MKKMFFLFIGFVFVIAFSACSKKTEVIDVPQLADKLKEEVGFADPMSELEENMFEVLYEVEPEDVVQKKIYVSTGATAEEIAVFESNSDEGAKNIKNALIKRVDAQKESFESYLPAEMEKLEDPVIILKDKYVILCVSSNNEKAKEIIG